MTDLNEIISEYMAKRGVKDEHFISPHGWKEIAVLFAKEASKEQRVICSESAQLKDRWALSMTEHDINPDIIDKESIINAKSPV